MPPRPSPRGGGGAIERVRVVASSPGRPAGRDHAFTPSGISTPLPRGSLDMKSQVVPRWPTPRASGPAHGSTASTVCRHPLGTLGKRNGDSFFAAHGKSPPPPEWKPPLSVPGEPTGSRLNSKKAGDDDLLRRLTLLWTGTGGRRASTPRRTSLSLPLWGGCEAGRLLSRRRGVPVASVPPACFDWLLRLVLASAVVDLAAGASPQPLPCPSTDGPRAHTRSRRLTFLSPWKGRAYEATMQRIGIHFPNRYYTISHLLHTVRLVASLVLLLKRSRGFLLGIEFSILSLTEAIRCASCSLPRKHP